MGRLYAYKCSKCGNEFRVRFGGGFFYGDILKEQMDKVRNGEYGEHWKKLFEGEKGVKLDAGYSVFHCDNCGSWERKSDMSLYKPVSPELANDDYIIPWYYLENYVLLEEYTYNCEKCGSKMKKLTYETIDKLECPECGELCDKYANGNWD